MRFSSVTAWVPIGVILALHGHDRTSLFGLPSIAFLIRTCAVFGLLGIFLACMVDRYFYGFWTIPFLGSFHFNVVLGNATLYGSHPWHWYLTSGIPAITGLWLPFIVWDFGSLLLSGLPGFFKQKNAASRNLWIVIVVYTLAHSQANHKEFRFLLPILPLFCVLAGPHVRSFFRIWTWDRAAAQTQSPSYKLATLLPLATLMILANLIALMYLGLFHQSAPISVNHKVAAIVTDSLVRHRSDGEDQRNTFSIHYLTGACHSTPLHSYLHVPEGIHYDTWSLDCSPDCRSNPDILCESEEFLKDPVAFVEKAYLQQSSTCPPQHDDGDDSCLATSSDEGTTKLPPDFLVTYADYAMKLNSLITTTLGLEEVGRYSHGINGIRIGSFLKTGDGYAAVAENQGEAVYRRISVIGDWLELCVDEMVLYASPSLLQESQHALKEKIGKSAHEL